MFVFSATLVDSRRQSAKICLVTNFTNRMESGVGIDWRLAPL